MSVILKFLYPNEFYDSVFKVDYKTLYKNGVRGLIFDIDNTLAAHDIPEPPPEISSFVKKLTSLGFKLCLLSNNSEERVKLFNRSLGLFAVHKAGKPKRRGVEQAIKALGVNRTKIALIGDQLFTDIWCGNRSGLHTILVKPLTPRDEWTVKLKRFPEKPVMFFYLRKNIKRKK